MVLEEFFKFHHDYKDMFVSHGYAVAIIDHFSPRGIAIDFNFVNVRKHEAMSVVRFYLHC